MGRKYPPLTCKEVKRILKALGFEFHRQKGSHEHWKAVVDGRLRLVTVDCPKEPFVPPLLNSMVRQSGSSIEDWYRQLNR